MKGKLLKKTLAVSWALMIAVGSVPTYSNVDLFLGTSVTASAEEQGTQTVNFTTVGSITDIYYSVCVGDSTNDLPKPVSVNIEGGTKVKVKVAYDSGYKPTLTAECTVSNSINVTSSDDSGNRIVTYEFTMPHTGNVKVQIQMNPIYSTLTVANTENGTVSVRTPKTSYPTGEKVYLDITPDEGYTISTSEYSYNEGSSRVSKQIQNDENGYYINMPQADTTVNVQFSKILNVYIDNYNNNNNERGSVEVTSPLPVESIHENSYVYLKVTPAEGYKFKGIDVVSSTGSVDVKKNGEQENEFYFLMPDSDVIVYSTFVPTKTVTLTTSENGTVELKNDSVNVDSGDRVILDVRPKVGYALSDLWCKADGIFHVCDIDEQGYYYFEMPEHDVEVHAEFVESRTVTVDLGEGHGELANKFNGISGYTVNGTEISYAVPKAKDTVGEVEEDFANRARDIASGKVIDADGKKFMGQIRLHSEYQNEELYQQELGSNLPAEGMTFKAMWADPISELTITAPNYKCGTELETSTQDSTTRYKPCNVQLSEGVSLRDYHLFYTNWLMENNETVLRGGKSYNIYGYIEANYNTYLTDDLTIKVENGELVSYDPKWSRFEISVPIEHDLDENGVCTSCGERNYPDGITEVIINSANITLGGELGLNFYLTIPDDVVTAGAKVVMDGPEGEKEVVLSSLTKDDKGRYKVTYKIKAVYINENVSLNVTDSDGNTLDLFKASGSQVDNNTLVYSIYDYVQSAKADTALTEKEHNMVDTMYTYGAYSAKWFNGTALPDDVNELNDLNMSDYEKYKLQTDGSSSSITLTGLSLILDSNTALRLYFTSADDISGHSAKIDDVDLTIHPTETVGKYYVEIDDISANNLISNYSIVFDGTYTATVSTMTYVYNSLKNGTTDDVMNVLKALCAYSAAVNKS